MIRKIELQSGGILLLSLLLFLLDSRMLTALLGNIVVHEWGHIYMLQRSGVYINRITVGFMGICIVCNLSYIPRRVQFLCSAAGPIFGLCGAFASSILGNLFAFDFLLLFAGIGVVLSLFNCIPVKPLDGGRMLQAAAPKLVQPVGLACGTGILIFGIYVMVCGYGTALACMGIFLLLQDEKIRGRGCLR